MAPDLLITHNGRFHVDEAMSYVVLSRIFPEASLVRTRDPRALAERDSIVFDVGGTYEPENGRFDHHQSDAPRRPDGSPFSAFGLIWRKFGHQYLQAIDAPEKDIDEIHLAMDEALVRTVDLFDNGVMSRKDLGPAGKLTIFSLFDDAYPEGADRKTEDAAFLELSEICGKMVESMVLRISFDIKSREMVRNAVENCRGPVLELPFGASFRDEIERSGADHILFVVHPRRDDWALVGVTCRLDGSYDLRRDLPEEWAGLSGEDLVQVTGIPDANFCHKGRFLAIAGSRKGVLDLARLAVECDIEKLPEP